MCRCCVGVRLGREWWCLWLDELRLHEYGLFLMYSIGTNREYLLTTVDTIYSFFTGVIMIS